MLATHLHLQLLSYYQLGATWEQTGVPGGVKPPEFRRQSVLPSPEILQTKFILIWHYREGKIHSSSGIWNRTETFNLNWEYTMVAFFLGMQNIRTILELHSSLKANNVQPYLESFSFWSQCNLCPYIICCIIWNWISYTNCISSSPFVVGWINPLKWFANLRST